MLCKRIGGVMVCILTSSAVDSNLCQVRRGFEPVSGQTWIWTCVRSDVDLNLCQVRRGFEPVSGQTKDYTIDISCFFTKHTAWRSQSEG